jgi:hypothetical protein
MKIGTAEESRNVVPEGVDNETTVTAEITCQVSTPHVTAASS